MSEQDDEATALREYGMRCAVAGVRAFTGLDGWDVNAAARIAAIVASVDVPVSVKRERAPADERHDQCPRCDALGYHDNQCHLCRGTGWIELAEQPPESAPTKPRWRLRTICCGRDWPPSAYYETWGEADAARQSYVEVGQTDMPRHERVGIIEDTNQPPESAPTMGESLLRFAETLRQEDIAAADAAGYLRGLETAVRIAKRRALASHVAEDIRALIAAAQSEKQPPERTPSDYAIEFGEHLAQAAEHMLQTFGEAPEGEDDEISDAQRDARSDAWSGLKSSIHEFRKRAARCRG